MQSTQVSQQRPIGTDDAAAVRPQVQVVQRDDTRSNNSERPQQVVQHQQQNAEDSAQSSVDNTQPVSQVSVETASELSYVSDDARDAAPERNPTMQWVADSGTWFNFIRITFPYAAEAFDVYEYFAASVEIENKGTVVDEQPMIEAAMMRYAMEEASRPVHFIRFLGRVRHWARSMGVPVDVIPDGTFSQIQWFWSDRDIRQAMLADPAPWMQFMSTLRYANIVFGYRLYGTMLVRVSSQDLCELFVRWVNPAPSWTVSRPSPQQQQRSVVTAPARQQQPPLIATAPASAVPQRPQVVAVVQQSSGHMRPTQQQPRMIHRKPVVVESSEEEEEEDDDSEDETDSSEEDEEEDDDESSVEEKKKPVARGVQKMAGARRGRE